MKSIHKIFTSDHVDKNYACIRQPSRELIYSILIKLKPSKLSSMIQTNKHFLLAYDHPSRELYSFTLVKLNHIKLSSMNQTNKQQQQHDTQWHKILYTHILFFYCIYSHVTHNKLRAFSKSNWSKLRVRKVSLLLPTKLSLVFNLSFYDFNTRY